jgi:hypothetical protein
MAGSLRADTGQLPVTGQLFEAHNLWKQSWALCMLARFACEDSRQLVTKSQDLRVVTRRSRMRLIKFP